MKANELMIGDWIQIVPDAPVMPNEYHRIDWIRTGEIGLDNRKIVTYPYIQPILLTPEILENNGFYEVAKGSEHREEFAYIKEIVNDVLIEFSIRIIFYSSWIMVACCNYHDKGRTFRSEISFVHELQHALRLCEIKKEIEL